MLVPLQYNTYFKQNIFSAFPCLWFKSVLIISCCGQRRQVKLARRFHVGHTTKSKISVCLHYEYFSKNGVGSIVLSAKSEFLGSTSSTCKCAPFVNSPELPVTPIT